MYNIRSSVLICNCQDNLGNKLTSIKNVNIDGHVDGSVPHSINNALDDTINTDVSTVDLGRHDGFEAALGIMSEVLGVVEKERASADVDTTVVLE